MPEPTATADPHSDMNKSVTTTVENGQTMERSVIVENNHKLKHPHACYVLMLDGQNAEFKVERGDLAKVLYDLVIQHLGMLESDYFGLSFKDSDGRRSWLYKEKRISKQVSGREWQFSLQVKFYPTDPTSITDDMTRYQLCLQVQRDVASGRLPCSMATAALLGSLMVQSTLCDFDANQHTDPQQYLAQFCFAPTSSKELIEKVHELYKMHKGQTQAEADLHYLENASKLNMYGVDLHPAKDSAGNPVQIGVCASGINVYQQQIRTARYVWPKIFKISYRDKYFKVKMRPGEYDKQASNIVFKTTDGKAAKRVWKSGVEHHGFFRLMQPEDKPKRSLMRFGSTRFRYTGRTQFQSRMNAQINDRPTATVQRSQSARLANSTDSSVMVTSVESTTTRMQSSTTRSSEMPGIQRQTTVDCVRQAVEPQTPLHYMDSGLTDTVKSSSLSSPMSPGEKSLLSDEEHGVKYVNGVPESEEVILVEQVTTESVSVAQRKREQQLLQQQQQQQQHEQHHLHHQSPGEWVECGEHVVQHRELEHQPLQQYAGKTEEENDEHRRKAKKVVEISVPLSKAEKEQQKKDEKERKRLEKEEKDRLKKEEKERKKAEKEAKKKGKTATTTTTTVTSVDVRQQGKAARSGSTSSSSSSSSSSDDDEGKEKDKKREKRLKKSKSKDKHDKHDGKEGSDRNNTSSVSVTLGGGRPSHEDTITYQRENLIENQSPSAGESSRGQMVVGGHDGQTSPVDPNMVVSEQRSEHTEDGPVEVTTEVDEHGNIITHTRQLKTTTRTVQRQVQYQYDIPADQVGTATGNALALGNGQPAQGQEHATVRVFSNAQHDASPITSEGGNVVETRSRVIKYETNGHRQQAESSNPMGPEPDTFVSSRTVSSGNRTIETVTYKTERDGVIETHVEHRITIHSGDDIDHDAELSSAIMDATKMNPDMTVEKIEVKQETQC